jgi:hypothetical protein
MSMDDSLQKKKLPMMGTYDEYLLNPLLNMNAIFSYMQIQEQGSVVSFGFHHYLSMYSVPLLPKFTPRLFYISPWS